MADLNQLRLLSEDLSNLPENKIPEGYSLISMDPDDPEMIDKWNKLNDEAFGSKNNFPDTVGKHWGYFKGGTYAIMCGDDMVATCTAIYDPKRPDNYGYLHMVAADKSHSGRGLGYQVCLAAMRKIRELGACGAWLTTDDFRLPAVVIYLKLGMLPKFAISEHKSRWIEVVKNIGREDLIPFLENQEIPKEEDALC